MNSKRAFLSQVLLAVLIASLSVPAEAWGPDAQRKTALAALKVVRVEFDDALEGHLDAIEEGVREPQQVVLEMLGVSPQDSLKTQLSQVVREMDRLKITSAHRVSDYTAYRFAVLSQFVGDVELPFAIPRNEEEKRLQEIYDQLLDENYKMLQYDFSEREFLHYPVDNFTQEHKSVEEGSQGIAQALNRGQGFNEQVANASLIYYMRAVNAIADVWYTILRERDPIRKPTLTDYEEARFYAQEVAYLARRGRGLNDEAAVAYTDFEAQDQEEPRFYEMVGDAYLAFYHEERERGTAILVEWERERQKTLLDKGEEIIRDAIAQIGSRAMVEYVNALRINPDYAPVKEKGVAYYLVLGKEYLGKGQLEDADISFASLLRFDSLNDEGIQLKADVKRLIEERNRRRARMEEFIATGDDLFEEAFALQEENDLSGTIKTYRQAGVFYNLVTDEFLTINQEAQQGYNRVDAQVDTIILTAIEEAEDSLSLGKNEFDIGRYLNAIEHYDRAIQTIGFIDPTFTEWWDRVKEVVDDANRQKEEAVLAQARETADQSGQS